MSITLQGGLAISIGIAALIIHILSPDIVKLFGKALPKFTSVAAGISVAYLFMQLLPEFIQGVIETNRLLFLTSLMGFLSFNLIEKYIYQTAPENKLARELAIEDSIIHGIYYFMVGLLLVYLANISAEEVLLFGLPVLIHLAISTLPLDVSKSHAINFLIGATPILGVLAGTYFLTSIPIAFVFSMIGFVIGTMLFTITRHAIPQGKAGEPMYFALGATTYALLILISWSLRGII